jgi:GNAT superfamily N-acetyltransferase
MSIKVRSIGINEIELALEVLNNIPEFDHVYTIEEIEKRISRSESIILIAEFAGKAVGCKIAYNRYFDGSVYSWLGGVLPPFRNQGIAQELHIAFERLAKQKFFRLVRLKTWNKHVAMLHFALKNGYVINGFEKKEKFEESRIEMIKEIG